MFFDSWFRGDSRSFRQIVKNSDFPSWLSPRMNLSKQCFIELFAAFDVKLVFRSTFKVMSDASISINDVIKIIQCFFQCFKLKVQMLLQSFLQPKNHENFYSTTPPTYQMILFPSRAFGRKGKSLYVYISVRGKRTKKFEEKTKGATNLLSKLF